MKKITSLLLIMTLTALFILQTAFADGTTAVTALVNSDTGKVAITGNATSKGQLVTLLVRNPLKSVEYVAEAIAGNDGHFSFDFTLYGKVNGLYTVSIGGDITAATTFIYKSKQDDRDRESSGGGGNNANPSTTPAVTPGKTDETSGKAMVKVTADTSYNAEKKEAVATVSAQALRNALSNAAPDAQGVQKVIVEVAAKDGAAAYGVSLPASALIGAANTRIEVQTSTGTVVVRGDMFNGSSVSNDATIGLFISRANDSNLLASFKSGTIVNLSVTVNGEPVSWKQPISPMSVILAYKLTASEALHPENITVRAWEGNSLLGAPVPSARFTPASNQNEAGMVSFKVIQSGFYGVTSVFKSFEDLGEHSWASQAIEILAAKGIIAGTTDTHFAPSANIKRADFLMMLVNSLGLAAEPKAGFEDVNSGDYYYEAVGIAYALGIANGVENNRFEPQAEITRQDMMTLTARALRLQGIVQASASSAALGQFTDQSSVSAYAAESVAQMVQEGVIQGDGASLKPLQNATRAETAVIMYRIYNKQ